MENIKIETTQNIDIDYNTAGVGYRLLAFIIDLSFLIITLFSFIFIYESVLKLSFNTFVVFLISFYLFTYHFWCEVLFNGQSIGKRIMKIRVVMIDGTSPSIGNYLLRWLLRPIDISLVGGSVGLLSMILTEKSQRLGDHAAKTTVVRLDNLEKISNTIFVKLDDNYTIRYPEVSKLNDNDISIARDIIEANKVDDQSERIVNATYYAKEKFAKKMGVEIKETPLHFFNIIIKDYNAHHGIV